MTRSYQKAAPRRIKRWLGFCLNEAVWSNRIIFKSCLTVTQLAARAVEHLGYEAVIMQGRAREWDTGRTVDHIWVEIPELGIGVETNPSQVLDLAVPTLVLPLHRFQKFIGRFERPEALCMVTPEGAKFFDQLARDVAVCVRAKR